MREIKFRAKIIDLKEWVHGDLYYKGCRFPHIYSEEYNFERKIVDISTIGQFTGMKDRKGTDIYEGDLLKDLNGIIYEVWYSDDKACYTAEMINPKNDMVYFLGATDSLEVIGNKFDNK